MKIHFLGTGAAEGWPGVFCACEHCVRARKAGGKNIRTRQQLLIDEDTLIDLGPDTYAHALMNGLDFSKITACIITHPHQDHYYPLELAMHRMPFAHNPAHITLYGSDKTIAEYNASVNAAVDDEEALKVSTQEVRVFEEFMAGDMKVLPLNALHARTMRCMFYLLQRNGSVVLQAYDTGWYPDETWAALEGFAQAGGRVDAVIMDCTSGVGREGTNHSGLVDNSEIKEKLQQIGIAKDTTRWIVTHFSHNGKHLHDELVEEADKRGFEVAYDGWAIEV